MSVVGYARINSVEERLDEQLSKLRYCDHIFQEAVTGTLDKCPRLEDCLEYIREGDTLVVTSLDRLARSTLHFCRVVHILKSKQVNLQILEQNINTNEAGGDQLFIILRVIEEFEMALRANRQRNGIQKARKRGIHTGRKKILTQVQAEELQRRREKGELIKTLMHDYGISKVSVYRYLAQT